MPLFAAGLPEPRAEILPHTALGPVKEIVKLVEEPAGIMASAKGDPAVYRRIYGYHENGKLAREERYLVSAEWSSQDPRGWSWVTSSEGRKTVAYFDKEYGRKLREIVYLQAPGGQDWRVWDLRTYVYDNAGRLRRVTKKEQGWDLPVKRAFIPW